MDMKEKVTEVAALLSAALKPDNASGHDHSAKTAVTVQVGERGELQKVMARRVSDDMEAVLARWGLEASHAASPFDDETTIWCVYRPAAPTGAAILWNLLRNHRSATTEALRGVDGVAIAHAMMARTDYVLGDGEKVVVRRWLLWNDKPDEPYVITSEYASRDMMELVTLMGPPPWEPPLRIRLEERPTKQGRKVLRVAIVLD